MPVNRVTISRERLYVAGSLAVLSAGALYCGWLLNDRSTARSASELQSCLNKSTSVGSIVRCQAITGSATTLSYVGGVLSGLGAALVGTVVVLFLVDWLLGSYERRIKGVEEEAREVGRLLAQVRSGSVELARSAIEEMRSHGVLGSGSLKGCSFRGARLAGASLEGALLAECDFSGADLRGAQLIHSKLTGAKLDESELDDANMCWADLSHAEISESQLRKLGMLWNAILPNGGRYDGRFELPGDIAHAQQYGIDVSSPTELREFYSGNH